MLPPQTELLGYVLSREARRGSQGLFEPRPDRLAHLRAEVGVAQELPQPIVHDAIDQGFELLQREVRELHGARPPDLAYNEFRLQSRKPFNNRAYGGCDGNSSPQR